MPLSPYLALTTLKEKNLLSITILRKALAQQDNFSEIIHAMRATNNITSEVIDFMESQPSWNFLYWLLSVVKKNHLDVISIIQRIKNNGLILPKEQESLEAQLFKDLFFFTGYRGYLSASLYYPFLNNVYLTLLNLQWLSTDFVNFCSKAMKLESGRPWVEFCIERDDMPHKYPEFKKTLDDFFL